ncbi:MAG TPA: hypothetical protein VLI65_03210 [Pyrinomonadaceae bacterium]|nr:hypothetical protein [Pyrinomonadaceae bacterium]
MSKKFDTNPLDADFPEKAKAAAANTSPQTPYGPPDTAPQSPYSTAEFPSVTEEETKKFSEADFQAYWHNNYQPAGLYQPPIATPLNQASTRRVPKVGLPEKWLIGLPYLPFSIGLVAGLILLLIIPKEENKVRFHAAQGLAAHVAILIVSAILGLVGNLTNSNFGGFLFGAITTVMLIIFAIKAWRGKPVHIESIDDLTNWLEEKIGPIK